MHLNRLTGNRRFSTVLIAQLCLLFCSGSAVAAANFTEAEWIAWPSYCKAGFLASDWSRGSPYHGRMPEGQVRSLRQNHDVTVGIPGVHHFCIGMIYTNRAKNMSAGPKLIETLRNAINEIEYSYSRMSPAAPKFSLVTAYYGTALYRSGKRQQAFDMWNKGIETKPDSRESYLAMAEILLSEKNPKEALEVLNRYESAKTGEAADVEAFLAFTYIELGMNDKAKEHADNAYQLGYPLPGLRNRIERLNK